jgi:PHD/YefM family antitoxin component YafN of YafNO toxin-antitoxin module
MTTRELDKSSLAMVQAARRSRTGPLVLTRRGRPVAALVLLPDQDMETLSLANNPDFMAMLDRSLERLDKEGGISLEDMRHRLGVAPKPRKPKRTVS